MPMKPKPGRYERATQPVATRARFVARLTSNTLVALGLIGVWPGAWRAIT